MRVWSQGKLADLEFACAVEMNLHVQQDDSWAPREDICHLSLN